MTTQTLPSAYESHPLPQSADAIDAVSLVRRTLDRTRRVTLDCVADFDDLEARRGAEWGVNPASWILGHLAYAQLRLGLHFAFGVQVDVGTLAPFARGAAPIDPQRLPTLDSLREELHHALSRVKAILDLLNPADLERPNSHVLPPFPELRTRADVLVQCALHESQHAGQLMMLRKLLHKVPIARFA